MADEAASRRERLGVTAYDPVSGGEIEIFISHDRLQALRYRTRGQIKDAEVILPLTLQSRGPVFEGLRREEDEPRDKTTGWRCYSWIPDRSFAEDGEELPPRGGRVFVVFINDERVAYNWRWERADPNEPDCPLHFATRSKRRLA